MRILTANITDTLDGAGKAAYRLHQALIEDRHDSLMLVNHKAGDLPSVIGPETRFEKALAKTLPILDNIPVSLYKEKTKTLFSPAWISSQFVVRKINQIGADIVHFHWINNGMLRIEDLARIKAPIVWSLHDMFAFTGGCHYNEDCEGFFAECGNCRVLRSTKQKDLSWRVFSRKRKVYPKIKNLTFVGLSKWITKNAKESVLLRDSNVVYLPNLINVDLYKPLDQTECRNLYRLPGNKKLILFGAMDATSDARKGFVQIKGALNRMHNNEGIDLVVFGSSKPTIPQGLNHTTHYVGIKYDDESLVALYNACDVCIVPSIQENLSNVIMESLSCGTPIVAFDIGGNSDLITHKVNGYLARPYESEDLAGGIRWILESSHEEYKRLCEQARSQIITNYSMEVVTPMYTDLYHKIIESSHN